MKATVLAIVHAFQHLWLFLFGPESVATYHPYLVGISLLGLCEPKFLLVIVAALYSAFTVVLWVLLFVIGFAFKGVRGGKYCFPIYSPLVRAADPLDQRHLRPQSNHLTAPSPLEALSLQPRALERAVRTLLH